MRKEYRQFTNNAGNLLMAAGALLLSVFFVQRANSEAASQAGLESFRQARELAASAVDTSPDVGGDGEVAPGELIPDFSLWSEKRIREYEAALVEGGDLPLAVLTIDRLKLQVPVYNGATDFNLNRGVARIRGTARVGEASNLGIAGHRDGFFRGLQDVAIGDHLDIESLDGRTRYQVESIEIVDPGEVRVLAPTDAGTVTLVTCYPFYFVGNAPQRYIVTAKAEPVQVRS